MNAATHYKVSPKAGVNDFCDTMVCKRNIFFQIKNSAEMPRLRKYRKREM